VTLSEYAAASTGVVSSGNTSTTPGAPLTTTTSTAYITQSTRTIMTWSIAPSEYKTVETLVSSTTTITQASEHAGAGQTAMTDVTGSPWSLRSARMTTTRILTIRSTSMSLTTASSSKPMRKHTAHASFSFVSTITTRRAITSTSPPTEPTPAVSGGVVVAIVVTIAAVVLAFYRWYLAWKKTKAISSQARSNVHRRRITDSAAENKYCISEL
jgi:hypothetical protein